MKKTIIALLLFTSVGVSLPTLAAEPSLHEVYQAAGAGKLEDAQRMMHEVLQAHPNSGKAHYVEAELLVKQGQLKQASDELATAEKLAPGLPFATAQSVTSLKQSVAHHPASSVAPVTHMSASEPAADSHVPWGLLFGGLGLIAFVIWASKFMSRRNAMGDSGPTQAGAGGYRPAYPSAPNGGYSPAAYGAPGVSGVAPAAGPGIGSQMLGGLATGAAVGAGVVAGEALMHRFMDGHKSTPSSDQAFSSFDDIPNLPSTPLNDMGGNDFGIADSGSWEDGGASSDSDWS